MVRLDGEFGRFNRSMNARGTELKNEIATMLETMVQEFFRKQRQDKAAKRKAKKKTKPGKKTTTSASRARDAGTANNDEIVTLDGEEATEEVVNADRSETRTSNAATTTIVLPILAALVS